MQAFEKRRDRFEFFDSFENPLVNITFKLETINFLDFCKTKGYPSFHFFLFHLFEALKENDHFKYRIYDGEVIKIEEYTGSYTVINQDENLNFTRFENTPNLEEFIKRSLAAGAEATSTRELIHTGAELDLRTLKNYIFITCIPWLDFTSIQHPVFKAKSSDIPSIAWGKYTKTAEGLSIPFSVQAHHGFIDGLHIYKLAQSIQDKIKQTVNNNEDSAAFFKR